MQDADRKNAPWAYRNSDALCAQAHGLGLTALQADFVRCFALSAWLVHVPPEGPCARPPDARQMLDTSLAALLRDAGWPVRSVADPALDDCRELRWEFVPADARRAAHYCPGPSYHDRLRLELLLATWRNALLRPDGDAEALELLARRLADDSRAFGPDAAVPIGLLRRATAKRGAPPSPPIDRTIDIARRELAPLLARLERALWKPVDG